MFKLLNRISWVISILSGFLVIFLIFLSLGVLNNGFLENDGIIIWVIGIVIFGLIIKRVFLGSEFIKNRLEYFAESLKNNYIKSNLDFNKNKNKNKNIKIKDNESENKEEVIKTVWNNLKPFPTEYKKEKEEKNKYADSLGAIYTKKEKPEPGIILQVINSIFKYIKDFFSTNLIGKLGAILIFMAMIFFLKGVIGNIWEVIGPIGRITLGILIGFITYFTGIFLHKKLKLKNEGLILIGTGILINFAVILAGRYLVGDDGYLTEGITFIFLILNAVFAILTSIIYSSKVLLIFSFVFAYIIPFLIGAESSNTPYTLGIYSLVLSLGALFLSIRQKSLALFVISFIFGNILFLLAPFSSSLDWNFKLILTVILSIISIKVVYNLKISKNKDLELDLENNKDLNLNLNSNNISNKLIYVFVGTYVFIILNLFNSSYFFTPDINNNLSGTLINILHSNFSFILYNAVLIGMFILSIFLVRNITYSQPLLSINNQSPAIPFPLKKREGINSNLFKYLLFLPLFILVGILYSGINSNLVSVGNEILHSLNFSGFIIIYLIGFSFIYKYLSTFFKSLYFIILALFILSFNAFGLLYSGHFGVNTLNFVVGIGSSLIFLFISYYYSTKKDLSLLFPIGTIGTIFTLLPVLLDLNTIRSIEPLVILDSKNSSLIIGSIISVVIFALANLAMPFINNNFYKNTKNINSLIIGTLTGSVFIFYELFNYSGIYFPGVAAGLSFLGLAIIYFGLAFGVINKIGIKEIKKNESLKNILYNFIGISISLFSISIAFVFSDYPEIISTIWLFIASIMYYFYSKIKTNGSSKIFIGASVLFIIGLGKLGLLLDVVNSGDFKFLISFGIIFISLILNLYFIDSKNSKNSKKYNLNLIHEIMHIIGIGIMGLLLLKIIPSSGHGWSMLGISSFIALISVFYAKFNFKFLKYIFLILLILFSIFHILELESIFRKLLREDISYLKILQYLVTFILILNIFIWKKLNILKENLKFNFIINIILGVYLFLISNLYVLNVFDKIIGHYSLTIYWGLIASGFLIYGIQKDIIKYRTIGLYFLVLVTGKIFFIDMISIGNTNSRILAFALLGVIFIIISTLYTRKYGDNLLGEFRLRNLKSLDVLNEKDKEKYKEKDKLNLK